MFELIRERIARRRLLLGGAAAGVGLLAGGGRLAAAGQTSAQGDGALGSALPQANGDPRDGSAALARQATDGTAERWDYVPITRRAPLVMPNGNRMAFWIGYNVEYFVPGRRGSTATANGDPEPRFAGWREYGPRVGIWRMMDLLDKYGMRASVLLNSDVGVHYPEIIEEGNRRNWVWLAHGKTNSDSWGNMSIDEERVALAEVAGTIRQTTGQQPRGWLGPGLGETVNTPDLLAEQGFTYNCDWVNDDQPYPVRVRQGRMISVPYTLECNDLPLFNGRTVSGQTFYEIVTDHFDVLYEESAQRPRVMCLALHPMVINQPYRHKALDRVLEYITAHRDVWLTTSDDIADWYYANYYDRAVAEMRTPSSTTS
jgi:allantoinase